MQNSKDLISYTSTLKAGWPAGTIPTCKLNWIIRFTYMCRLDMSTLHIFIDIQYIHNYSHIPRPSPAALYGNTICWPCCGVILKLRPFSCWPTAKSWNVFWRQIKTKKLQFKLPTITKRFFLIDWWVGTSLAQQWIHGCLPVRPAEVQPSPSPALLGWSLPAGVGHCVFFWSTWAQFRFLPSYGISC